MPSENYENPPPPLLNNLYKKFNPHPNSILFKDDLKFKRRHSCAQWDLKVQHGDIMNPKTKILGTPLVCKAKRLKY